jgi:exopolysaccharide biosynthesis polyprenyl glycosylphosphotransferase
MTQTLELTAERTGINTPTTAPRTSSASPASGSITKARAQKTSHRWVYIAIAGDWVAAVVAAVAAFALRFHTSLHGFGTVDTLTLQQYAGHFWLGSVSLVAMLGWQGVYSRNAQLRSRWIKSHIFKTCVVWTAVFLTVTLTFKLQPAISRVYTILAGGCSLVTIVGWRVILDSLLRRPTVLSSLRQRTVIVGWTEEAARLHRTFTNDPHHAVEIIGWVDTHADAESDIPTDLPLLGSLSEMEDILEKHGVDMVIGADLSASRDEVIELSNLCERELVSFKIIPSCFRIFASGLHLETMAGTPILGIDRLPLDNSLNVALKRALDIVGGVAGLVMSAPIIALFSALVWLESRGSVFYSQRRTGLNGRPFAIFKIRSMKLNAEANGKVGWSTKNDPRRLRVGSFMRKWNIDELPQFWNVIKGDMSLVGPRPERPELIQNFKHEIPHYNARHHAKPGMTGWAQIKGLRGDTDLTERIRCDLWYMENWNLLLDLQIMALTFRKQKNAF